MGFQISGRSGYRSTYDSQPCSIGFEFQGSNGTKPRAGRIERYDALRLLFNIAAAKENVLFGMSSTSACCSA